MSGIGALALGLSSLPDVGYRALSTKYSVLILPPTLSPMAGRPLSYLASLPTDVVKGIGAAYSKKLAAAGIESVADLLLHAPRRYLDRSQKFDLAAVPLEEEVTVTGLVTKVNRVRLRGKGNRMMVDGFITDGTTVLQARWFNPYVKIEEGWEVLLAGKAERFQGKLMMKSPDIERMGAETWLTSQIVPIHPSAGGVSPGALRQSIKNAIDRARPIHESVPEDILDRLDLVDRDFALSNIHFPDEIADVAPAKKRLIFDELFRLELALALRKQRLMEESKGVHHDVGGELVKRFIAALPYELTGAQNRAIGEIEADLATPHAMHRLLQGEVGSGKTVVAAASLLTAVQGGFQGAVMAPTEVLAEQHYLGFRDLFETAGMAPPEHDGSAMEGQDNLFAGATESNGPVVRMALVTGNSVEANFVTAGTAKRSDVLEWIADGTVDLVVGTHSLIQESMSFRALELPSSTNSTGSGSIRG